jgi:ABC-type multidrug transport system fused ATPase/permease subunit
MSTLYKLLALLDSEQRKMGFMLLLMMLVAMVLETAGIGIIVPVLAVVTDPASIDKYKFLQVTDLWLGGGHNSALVLVVSVMMILFALKAGYLAFLAWWQARYIFSIEASLSRQLYTGYLCQPYEFHLQSNSALLVRNVTTGVGQFAGAVTSAVTLISESLVLVGIVALLLYFEPIGAVFVGCSMAVAGYAFYRLTHERILHWGRARQHHEGRRLQSLQQGLGGVRDVKLLGRERQFVAAYELSNSANASIGMRQSLITALPRLCLEVLTVMGLAGLVLIMLYQSKPVETIVPTLGLFAAAAFRLMPSANKVLNALQNLKYNLPFIDTLYEERGLLAALPMSSGLRERLPFSCSLRIEKLSYKYPSAHSEVLTEIELEIAFGTTVGFIGPSGAGKSTLINLILGLLAPSSGSILADGRDINDSLDAWQACVGYVPQSVFLIDDSLRRNIAFGLRDDEIDESAVQRAVAAAQLANFVSTLPEGLDTCVGERGMRLSGGQCQRIGIARALYHDAPLLVLDEASSSLDSATEAAVMETVNRLRSTKTVLIIAHRLSTLMDCDEIYEVAGGRLRRLECDELNRLISAREVKRA